MRIYLSGAMRHKKNFNFPLFAEWTAKLRAQGHTVFSPAESDISYHGTDISIGNDTGDEVQAIMDHGFDIRRALREDLLWILEQADAVYILPGSSGSKGVAVERSLAECLGLEIVELGSMAMKEPVFL